MEKGIPEEDPELSALGGEIIMNVLGENFENLANIRSVDDFPANEMAERFFNGGGHFNAAGGRLYCSLEEAKQITRDAIEAYREHLL